MVPLNNTLSANINHNITPPALSEKNANLVARKNVTKTLEILKK